MGLTVTTLALTCLTLLGAGYLGLHPPGFAAGTVALAFGLADRAWIRWMGDTE